MRCLLAVTAVSLLVAAAPAHAARGDRADAKAFAAATKELRAAVLALKPTLEENAHRLDRDPACFETFRHMPDAVAGDATELIFECGFEAQVQPIAAAYAHFIARISRAKVRARALRRGRAAHRRIGRTMALTQPPPVDICAELDAWRQAGYPKDAARRDPARRSESLRPRLRRTGPHGRAPAPSSPRASPEGAGVMGGATCAVGGDKTPS